jgi:hypothetical protein
MTGVGWPAAAALFQQFPIGPAEQGEIEVSPSKAADFAHDRGASALSAFHLVGDKDDFGDHGHRDGAERMVADGGEGLVVRDSEALLEDVGCDRPVEEDRVDLIDRADGDAALTGEPQLLGWGVGTKEIVSPCGQFDTEGVEVPSRGEVKGFDKDSLDVPGQACRPQE